jgi:iron complex outermembrane recepter protein
MLDIIASIVYEGSRVSESTGARPVDSFTVANLKGSWEFRSGWIAELGANNVLDEDYAYDEGYPEPGRNFFVNLHYRFRN